MDNIKQRSGILIWSDLNINSTPSSPGVYVIRSLPTNGAVIYIGKTSNLKQDLLKHYTEETFPEARFYDWYSTKTQEDADIIKKEWDSKYNL